MTMPNTSVRSPRSRAFTLVELLVVVAIIALLLSILLPALDKARLHARDVVCRSQMRQVGMAMTFYQSDHEDRYPGDEVTGSTFVRFGKGVPATSHPVLSKQSNDEEETFGLPVVFDRMDYAKGNKVHVCPGQSVIPAATSTYDTFSMRDWGNTFAVNILSGDFAGIAGKKGVEVMEGWRADRSNEEVVRSRWYLLYDNWRTYPGTPNVDGGGGVFSNKAWHAAIPHRLNGPEVEYGPDLFSVLAGRNAFNLGGYNLVWPDLSVERMKHILNQ